MPYEDRWWEREEKERERGKELISEQEVARQKRQDAADRKAGRPIEKIRQEIYHRR